MRTASFCERRASPSESGTWATSRWPCARIIRFFGERRARQRFSIVPPRSVIPRLCWRIGIRSRVPWNSPRPPPRADCARFSARRSRRRVGSIARRSCSWRGMRRDTRRFAAWFRNGSLTIPLISSHRSPMVDRARSFCVGMRERRRGCASAFLASVSSSPGPRRGARPPALFKKHRTGSPSRSRP